MPYSKNLSAYPSQFLRIANKLHQRRARPDLGPLLLYSNLPRATATSTRHRLNAFCKALSLTDLPYAQIMRYFEFTLVATSHPLVFDLVARHRDYLYKNLNPELLDATADEAELQAHQSRAAEPQVDTTFDRIDELFQQLMSVGDQQEQPTKPAPEEPQSALSLSLSASACSHTWKEFPNDPKMQICTKCDIGRPKPATTPDGGGDYPGAHLLANVPVPGAKLLPLAIDNAIRSTDNTNAAESPATTIKPNPGD